MFELVLTLMFMFWPVFVTNIILAFSECEVDQDTGQVTLFVPYKPQVLLAAFSLIPWLSAATIGLSSLAR